MTIPAFRRIVLYRVDPTICVVGNMEYKEGTRVGFYEDPDSFWEAIKSITCPFEGYWLPVSENEEYPEHIHLTRRKP